MKKLILIFALLSNLTNAQISSWVLTGNNNVTGSTKFLGSTTNNALRFRTNNLERLLVDSTHGGVWNGLRYPTEPTYIGSTLLSKTKGDLLYAPISYSTAVQYATAPLSITTNTISLTYGTGLTVSGGALVTSAIPNASLVNSTISGISLGSNLNSLFTAYGLSGSSYNGSAMVANWKVDTTLIASKLFTAANYAPISYTASVPTSRTLTINGTTYDLSANRTWTVGDALVANPLSQFASTTSAQLATVLSDENGSAGGFVRATSPTLTTPDVGVATATSINKVVITAPATSSTLTVANGKSLTANNSLTLAGTDATTITTPAWNTSVMSSNSLLWGGGSTVTTTVTTAVTITGYTFTAEPNARYAVHGVLKTTCSSTGGIKYTVAAPGASTIGINYNGNTSSTTGWFTQVLGSPGSFTGAYNTAATTLNVLLDGTISADGTGGTVSFQFAAQTSGQTATINKEGSYIIITRIE